MNEVMYDLRSTLIAAILFSMIARHVLAVAAIVRTSAPDANSCAGCHNTPRSGGAGDIVANVFVLAQALDPVTLSTAPQFTNERNTLGMFGSGAIEMLAREMTVELQAQAAGLPDGTHTLTTKGVDFEVTMPGEGRWRAVGSTPIW